MAAVRQRPSTRKNSHDRLVKARQATNVSLDRPRRLKGDRHIFYFNRLVITRSLKIRLNFSRQLWGGS